MVQLLPAVGICARALSGTAHLWGLDRIYSLVFLVVWHTLEPVLDSERLSEDGWDFVCNKQSESDTVQNTTAKLQQRERTTGMTATLHTVLLCLQAQPERLLCTSALRAAQIRLREALFAGCCCCCCTAQHMCCFFLSHVTKASRACCVDVMKGRYLLRANFIRCQDLLHRG
jgi:hypothetical protein